MSTIDKKQVLAALQARLTATLETLTASQKSVQSGAVHPESRQEHPKDTRSTEAGYLARGLAERVETLRDEVRAIAMMPARNWNAGDAAGPGALVTIEDADGAQTLVLLAPGGGGETIAAAGQEILVLTPLSPLGAALAGRRCGDAIEVELPSGKLEAEVLQVS